MLLFSFDFSSDTASYKMHVFELITDGEVEGDLREWQWNGWLTTAEVELLAGDSRLCPDTAIFYSKYQGRHG